MKHYGKILLGPHPFGALNKGVSNFSFMPRHSVAVNKELR